MLPPFAEPFRCVSVGPGFGWGRPCTQGVRKMLQWQLEAGEQLRGEGVSRGTCRQCSGRCCEEEGLASLLTVSLVLVLVLSSLVVFIPGES